ncbi:hypothetical protein [Methylopila sp. M107]|uniref:hypothetical protein n=1 Tax=Methylopila sp. M107 TaxID=1101190 RepID=UPI00036ABD5F|nr:hypothetical protein [Methylopila sp. M107]
MRKTAAAITAAVIGLALAGCAGGAGDPCRSAGHTPRTVGYDNCEAKRADDQARGARRIANEMPIGGYGPIGRF